MNERVVSRLPAPALNPIKVIRRGFPIANPLGAGIEVDALFVGPFCDIAETLGAVRDARVRTLPIGGNVVFIFTPSDTKIILQFLATCPAHVRHTARLWVRAMKQNDTYATYEARRRFVHSVECALEVPRVKRTLEAIGGVQN